MTVKALKPLILPAAFVLNQAPVQRAHHEPAIVAEAIDLLIEYGLPIAPVGLRQKALAYQTSYLRRVCRCRRKWTAGCARRGDGRAVALRRRPPARATAGRAPARAGALLPARRRAVAAVRGILAEPVALAGLRASVRALRYREA